MAITRLGGANAISGAITSSNLPTGSVIQSVTTNFGTYKTTNSTSYVDLTLSNSITPISTSSKILLFANIQVNRNASSQEVHFKVQRNSSDFQIFERATTGDGAANSHMLSVLDTTHNSTNQLTYDWYWKVRYGTDTARVNDGFTGNTSAYRMCTFTLQEIQG